VPFLSWIVVINIGASTLSNGVHDEQAGSDNDPLQMSDAELWFASKRLLPDRKLSQYVGKNEKTKVHSDPYTFEDRSRDQHFPSKGLHLLNTFT
jgi:hypothetical protein